MTLRDYQTEALRTDQVPGTSETAMIVPLLGLAGEVGTLLTEYKKRLREGDAYRVYADRVAEELGDILWYVSNVASKAGLNLDDIARANLEKTTRRWTELALTETHEMALFDTGFPEAERLPRIFRIVIDETVDADRARVAITLDGAPVGDALTDNAYEEDGYRYHDIFHLAYAAVLGWSPVTRKLMGRKRKSAPRVDEVEDGGRATAIEEGISALVFDYARDHSFLDSVDHVDYGVLRTIRQLTRNLEVSTCSEYQWQDAILKGFAVWRRFRHSRRGLLVGDLLRKTIEFELLP
jgi:NTP pyrophosphatase (non-canonical NTP hydrolase)